MDASFDLVDEVVVLVRDLRDQHLAPMRHERLKKADEVPRQLAVVGFLDDCVLPLRADAWRLQEDAQPAVALDRIRDLVDHPSPTAKILAAVRQLEQRLGVVPGDRRLAHY